MRSLIHKWLLPAALLVLFTSFTHHPVYISITEIEHNPTEKTLEISCKIFTDDFEKALRAAYKTHVDLLNISDKKNMDDLVSDYVQKHVKISANGKLQSLQFKGFEQIEEAVYCYFEAVAIPVLKIFPLQITFFMITSGSRSTLYI